MATASIVADGTTDVNSSDFILATGESATLSIRGSGGPTARVRIQVKGSDSTYLDIGFLNSQNPVAVLTAVGTFRCVREASPTAYGVDKA